MKSISISLITATLLLGTQAFASSYSETPIADCSDFQMLEVEIGGQSPDGTVSSEKHMVIRDLEGEEISAIRATGTRWEFMLNEEQSIMVERKITANGAIYQTYKYNFGIKESFHTCVTK